MVRERWHGLGRHVTRNIQSASAGAQVSTGPSSEDLLMKGKF